MNFIKITDEEEIKFLKKIFIVENQKFKFIENSIYLNEIKNIFYLKEYDEEKIFENIKYEIQLLNNKKNK